MSRPREFDREAVLDRAMTLFWRQGYEATSIQELVEATGVNRASLYATFGDKHGLFLAAVDRYQETVSARRQAILERAGPALDALHSYFEDLLTFSLNDGRRLGCLITNSAVELSTRDGQVEERLRAGVSRLEDAFYRLLRRAEGEGSLPPGRDLRALARFLAGVVQGLRVMARLDPQEDRLRDVVETSLATVTGSVAEMRA